MYIIATQIREGMILNHEGELYRVSWVMHRTPGKGDACIQTKMKNILTGKNLEWRFRSSDKIEKAELETREMQYLYQDSVGYVFMDNENYEQHTLTQEMIGDAARFIAEGVSYQSTFYQDHPIGIELPNTIEFKVTNAPPEIRKATASSSLRPVTLENGMTIQAPAFIKEGDIVRIKTDTGDYLERV
ncbi:elongation factor P [Thermoproteota archaeon]